MTGSPDHAILRLPSIPRSSSRKLFTPLATRFRVSPSYRARTLKGGANYALDNFCHPADSLAFGIQLPCGRRFDPSASGRGRDRVDRQPDHRTANSRLRSDSKTRAAIMAALLLFAEPKSRVADTCLSHGRDEPRRSNFAVHDFKLKYSRIQVLLPMPPAPVVLSAALCAKDLPECLRLKCAFPALWPRIVNSLVRARAEHLRLKHHGRSFGQKRAFRMTFVMSSFPECLLLSTRWQPQNQEAENTVFREWVLTVAAIAPASLGGARRNRCRSYSPPAGLTRCNEKRNARKL